MTEATEPTERSSTPGKAGVPLRRGPFFYGWWIVAVAFLAHLAAAAHQSSTLSVFLKPMGQEFGVSRTGFSALRSAEGLLTSLIATLAGPLVDRYGARFFIVAGALIAGSGYVGLGLAPNEWLFFLIRLLPVSVGTAIMAQNVTNVAISNWFIRRRGRAVAIASIGGSFVKTIIAPLSTFLMLTVGWRGAWMVFGGATWILVVLPAAFLMRRRPEDVGLRPDGATDAAPGRLSREQRAALVADVRWTAREALRTQALWMVIFTYGIATIGITGLNLHLFPYLTDLGLPEATAALLLSCMALAQLSASLFWGFLVERVDIRHAMAAKFLIQALGLLLALLVRDPWLLAASLFLYGFGLGGSFVLWEVVWANFYGRLSLGTIRAIGLPATYIFGAVGPPFFGLVYDLTGSYRPSFWFYGAALLLSAVLVPFIRRPQRPVGSQDVGEYV